jgi:putative ABC transport system permease protein
MSPLDVARSDPHGAPTAAPLLPLWLRLAARELRTGLSGFAVFIGCIALGVMVITGVGALSDALRAGLSSQGRLILGGDLAFVRPHARATAAELTALAKHGRISETATLRSMARRTDGADQALAELKAVDGLYPLAGALKFDGATGLAEAISRPMSAAVEPLLLERLGLKIGDAIRIGDSEISVRAVLRSEPDGLGDRASFGPRILVSMDTLERTGLIQPGTLIRWRYAMALSDQALVSRESLLAIAEATKRDLPEAGFSISNRFEPSPQLTRTLERLRQFLTLIGLTSLIVGGVGVANAVSTFIDKRRKVIATMKSLGAPARLVFRIFLAQILAVAGLGILIGLALGYLIPVIAGAVAGDALPIRLEFTVTWQSIATATGYGFLVALLFALWPLGRAEHVPPSVLFRDDVSGERSWPRARLIVATALVAAALAAFIVLSTDAWQVALGFCGGLTVLLAVFWGIGQLVPKLVRLLPRSRRPELAVALSSIAAPGGLAGAIVLSLGLGLSLLVAVALVDRSLQQELSGRLPERSPTFYILDIGKSEVGPFETFIATQAPGSLIETAPMLRGRLVALNGVPAESVKTSPDAQWVLYGDRGLSFSAQVPAGSRVVQGDWWPAGYKGEPLVSFEAELARKLGLKIGDSVTVNVLGRNLNARIANLRELKWESLNLNFVLVFSPNTLEAAPYKLLSTVTLPSASSLEAEMTLARGMAKSFPGTTQVRVKEAIAQFNGILEKILVAVRVAGGVTLLAGALVLAGAMATAQRRRLKEAVILKALGVTRARILISHLMEYGLLSMIAGLFAVGLGTLAAWIGVSQVMEVPFEFSILAVFQALGLATLLIAAFGLAATSLVLRTPPVPILKSE